MKKESNRNLRNPKNFYSSFTSYDKIEQCKIYDKDGKLVKIISAQEIIDQAWKKMKLDL